MYILSLIWELSRHYNKISPGKRYVARLIENVVNPSYNSLFGELKL